MIIEGNATLIACYNVGRVGYGELCPNVMVSDILHTLSQCHCLQNHELFLHTTHGIIDFFRFYLLMSHHNCISHYIHIKTYN